MNFHSLYDQGFARVAAVTLPVYPARPFENAREIIDAARELDTRGVAMGVFPELCVSGYAIDDLLLQDVLLDNVEKALAQIVEASADLLPLLIVGAPLRKDNALYNCAVAIHRGRVLAIVPKSHLPNYREFYEKRHFVTMPPRASERIEVPWGGVEEFSGGPVWVPFGQVLLSADDVPGLTIGIEICEDMWVPVTPATELALAGATILANLSASPITVGRGADRELMVRSVSARCSAAYVYTAAGMGESSTDLAWDGEAMIYEAGDRLAIGERFQEGAHITIADVDLERLRTERKRQNSFTDNAQRYFAGDERMAPQEVEFTLDPPRTDLGLERSINRFPFVPNDPTRLEQDCYEAYTFRSPVWSSACARSATRRSSSASRVAWIPRTRWSWPPARWTCWAVRARTSCATRCPVSPRPSARRRTRPCCASTWARPSRRSTSVRPPRRCWPTSVTPTARARPPTT